MTPLQQSQEAAERDFNAMMGVKGAKPLSALIVPPNVPEGATPPVLAIPVLPDARFPLGAVQYFYYFEIGYWHSFTEWKENLVLHHNPLNILFMPASIILSASWEKYDQKKTLTHQDKDIFTPENLWEFNYLQDIIIKMMPSLDIITVMLAIRKTMRETLAPRPRVHFVHAVMRSIHERENQFTDLVANANKMAS